MSEVIGGRVPLSLDGNFQCKKYASGFMGVGVWNKPHQLNMNLKLKFTTRCTLKISNMEEDTGYLGKAAVLAIGTAVPPNYINQSDYPDYYFRVTNSEHLGELKEKFKRICGGTKIQKRHFCLTEKMIQDHPIIAGTNQEKSLNVRNRLLAVTPELGKEAANKALQEWGRSRSKITHVIFHSSGCSIDMPGPDYKMINLLGLSPAVNRTMLYYNGCYGGGAALRLAKDIVENNPSARVLAICSECTIGTFRGPSESSVGDLVSQALFSDAASAVIVGSNPDLSVEKPLFNIVSAKQTMCPGTDDAIHCHVTEAGVETFLSRNVTEHIANRVGKCTSDSLAPLGITDHNSLFWILHPGGPKILDGIEHALELEKDKLQVSRHILAEYGNESSASVFHVMDEMRRRSKKEGKATTGEGEEFGMLIGLGPGLTVETVVLRATAITK